MLTRRSLLSGLGAFVAAPAVIRTPGLLMPVRTIAVTPWVLDPVAMAISCIERPEERIVWRMRNQASHMTGLLVEPEVSHDSARDRVMAYLRDLNGYDFGRTDLMIAKLNPPRLDRIRPASAFI